MVKSETFLVSQKGIVFLLILILSLFYRTVVDKGFFQLVPIIINTKGSWRKMDTLVNDVLLRINNFSFIVN